MFYGKINKKAALRQLGASAVGAALATLAAGAHAADSKMFSFSGFGTAAVTHSSFKNGDFVPSTFAPTGAGYSHDYDLGLDSKLAGQLTATFTPQLTGVVQVVAQQRSSNRFSPKFEWANLKYAITPDLSVRVGRIALATYMVSESRQVGYANFWVRAPIETYSLLAFTNSDGIDASFRHRFGGASNTVQAWYGKTKVDFFAQSGHIAPGSVAKPLYGIADTVEMGALTARVGYIVGDMEVRPIPTVLLEGTTKLLNIGAIYDPGSWFVQGEYTKQTFDTVVRAQKAFYVSGGYRVNNFTPYLIYSDVAPDDNQVGKTTRDQTTISAGLRWDVRKNTAVKVQYDHIKLAPGNVGFFTNAKPGLAGSSGDVVTATVDFVF